jgi:hypothetical protein
VAFPFPFAPADGTVLGSAEVYDPKTGVFVAAGDVGPRVFAAGTSTSDGGAIFTGGIEEAGSPKNDLGNAITSSAVCSGKPLVCSDGPLLARPRAGHIMFRIDPDGVFVLGGSLKPSEAVGGLAGYQMERWSNDIAFQLINVAAMSVAQNVFFPLSAQYQEPRMLVGGGLQRDATGNFTLADDDAGRGPVFIFDDTAAEVGGIVKAADPQNPATRMHMQNKRWLGGGAPLPGNTRAVLAGGFSTLGGTAAGDVELFDEEGPLTVTDISVGGQPRTMRQPRGAVAAAAVGDGTVIFSGGQTDQPSATLEVFADPKTPPGVAE